MEWRKRSGDGEEVTEQSCRQNLAKADITPIQKWGCKSICPFQVPANERRGEHPKSGDDGGGGDGNGTATAVDGSGCIMRRKHSSTIFTTRRWSTVPLPRRRRLLLRLFFPPSLSNWTPSLPSWSPSLPRPSPSLPDWSPSVVDDTSSDESTSLPLRHDLEYLFVSYSSSLTLL